SLVLVADELSQGTLVAPFGPELEGFSLHLVRSSDRPLTEPVEAVRHWLKSEFAAAP
ncbi:LysR family transcriptional regulator, partial [Herbaspirillum sp. HC18]